MSHLLARGADVPLHRQIRSILEEQIANGTLKSGDRLPSEDELTAAFRVSRMTLRQAFSGLVSEGLVYRRHGKGTFVGDPKFSRQFARLTGFSEDLAARGLTPGASTFALRRTAAPAEVAEALGCKAGEPVVLVHRLRTLNGRPAAVQRSFLVAALVPGLEAADKTFPSLYELLRTRYGLVLHRADQVIESRPATATQARLLGMPRAAPVVHVIRTTFLDDGSPIEFVRMVYRADLFKFRMQLWKEAGEQLALRSRGSRRKGSTE